MFTAYGMWLLDQHYKVSCCTHTAHMLAVVHLFCQLTGCVTQHAHAGPCRHQAQHQASTAPHPPDGLGLLGLTVPYRCMGAGVVVAVLQSYVLLRQQYLTHGDSVSAWLGPNHKLKTRPLASYGSVLLDQPTQQELFNPLWTFARAKASDSDIGTRDPPSSAASIQAAPGGASAAAAAGGCQGASGAVAQPAAVLSTLTSVAEPGGGADAGVLQEQQQQQLGLSRANDSAYASSLAAAKAAAPAAASPFAVPGHLQNSSALLGRETLQMVQLSEVIFPVQSEGPGLQSAQQSDLGPLPQQTAGAAGSGPGVPDRSAAPSPAESDSVAGSRLMSRHSSGRALLAGRHVDSSIGSGLLAAEPSPQHASQPLDSAAGAVSHSGVGRVRRRFSGCAPGGGCGWRRLDDRPSTEEEAAAAAPYADSQRQLEREQRRMAARAAEKVAARRAAQQLGVDVPWWQFKTGDLLLDRHIVKVDMEQELDSAGGRGCCGRNSTSMTCLSVESSFPAPLGLTKPSTKRLGSPRSAVATCLTSRCCQAGCS